MSPQWAITFLCRRRDLRRQSDAVAQLSPSQLLPASVAEVHSPVEVVEVADLHPARNDAPVLVLPSLPAAGLPVVLTITIEQLQYSKSALDDTSMPTDLPDDEPSEAEALSFN